MNAVAGNHTPRSRTACTSHAKSAQLRAAFLSRPGVFRAGHPLPKPSDTATDLQLTPEIANHSPGSGKSHLTLGYKRHSN